MDSQSAFQREGHAGPVGERDVGASVAGERDASVAPCWRPSESRILSCPTEVDAKRTSGGAAAKLKSGVHCFFVAS